MKRLPIAIFFAIVVGAFLTGYCSFQNERRRLDADVNQALATTLRLMPCDRVDADTLRCYRQHISIAEIRDTAYLAMTTVQRSPQSPPHLVAYAGCDAFTVFSLSDQRASGALLALALLWLLGSMAYSRSDKQVEDALCLGGLAYQESAQRFVTSVGAPVRLTPMQQELLEMFFRAEGHTLSKQAICDRLWPKKPDASDTLYTLIRRLKPIVEAHSSLSITCERGKSYRLEDKGELCKNP